MKNFLIKALFRYEWSWHLRLLILVIVFLVVCITCFSQDDLSLRHTKQSDRSEFVIVDGEFRYYSINDLTDSVTLAWIVHSDSLFSRIIDESHFIHIEKRKTLIVSQKLWMRGILTSHVYFQRLLLCTEGDSTKCIEFYNDQIDRLDVGGCYLSNHRIISSPGNLGHTMCGDIFLPYSSRDEYTGEIQSPFLDGIDVLALCHRDVTPIHEFEHQADGWDFLEHVRLLLGEKFSFERFQEKYPVSLKDILYYQSVNEILARKRVFDYELEHRGIKRYEEEFTESHYEKVLLLSKHDYLTIDSDQFFHMFEKEDLMFIMNTVP